MREGRLLHVGEIVQIRRAGIVHRFRHRRLNHQRAVGRNRETITQVKTKP